MSVLCADLLKSCARSRVSSCVRGRLTADAATVLPGARSAAACVEVATNSELPRARRRCRRLVVVATTASCRRRRSSHGPVGPRSERAKEQPDDRRRRYDRPLRRRVDGRHRHARVPDTWTGHGLCMVFNPSARNPGLCHAHTRAPGAFAFGEARVARHRAVERRE